MMGGMMGGMPMMGQMGQMGQMMPGQAGVANGQPQPAPAQPDESDGGIGAEIYKQAYGATMMSGDTSASTGASGGGGGYGPMASTSSETKASSPYAAAGGVGRQQGRVAKFVTDRGFG